MEPWSRWLLVAMGACTPGGFLFLLALASGGDIHLDKAVWFLMAGAGGIGGYFLARRIERAALR